MDLKLEFSCLALAFLVSPTFVAAHAAQCDDVRYVPIDLGVLSQEFPFSTPQNINELGQVTGASSVNESDGRGFIWDCARGMENIGALAADDYVSFPLDINDHGTIVGISTNNQTGDRAFIWDRKRGMRAIAGLYSAYGISDTRHVLGGGEGVIQLWSEQSGAVPLESVVGVEPISSAQIDRAGRIGGTIGDTGSAQFFRWTLRQGLLLLGAIPVDASSAYVEAINARGDLSGILNYNEVGATIPFFFGANRELELLTNQAPSSASAHSINDRRQIVGRLLDESESFFIWDPLNGLRDLNEVVYGSADGNGTARITRVAAINNAGWIAASVESVATGTTTAHLFVAVPSRHRKYEGIGQLKGPRLCRALDALRREARRCDRK